jgi:hypothetical protein
MNAKRGMLVFVLVLASVLLMSSFASAGMFDWFGKITGKVTSQPVNVNISVTNTAPTIVSVGSVPAVGLNEGPVSTTVNINFTAADADGALNLNDSSAMVNFTRAGESVRLNISCTKNNTIGNNVVYTCNVPMYWFDGAGTWNVTVFVKDWSNSAASNVSTTFTVNALTGFVSAPAALTWAALTPGAVNQTSNNDPILMNNTGNQNITAGNVQLNTTDLLGETDANRKLYANNFSVGITTGGSPPVECGATTMAPSVYTAIGSAVLPRGNFTVNDGSTGQEQLYFCLKYAGTELTAQAYSSDTTSRAWTLKIA